MFNSKFDIYSSEWIDRVFENRNKNYGAYDIRKHYASNVLRALGITLLVLAAVFTGSLLFLNDQSTAISVHKVDVVNQNLGIRAEPRIKATDKISAPQLQPSHQRVANKKPVRPSTGNHNVIRNQPTIIPGLSASPLKPVTAAAVPREPENGASQQQVTLTNDEVDVKPTLAGGAEQWSRFLERNLHYPAEAKKNRISGKVWVSFIVERDGHVSHVEVEHGAGNGFDEEAVRVLNLSPVWLPGKQDGQAVRVKYSLPINFHIEHQAGM